jgi:NhaP-type Na+/H+ or K+/H+ antiporter/CRP-like cAMP-binding protein
MANATLSNGSAVPSPSPALPAAAADHHAVSDGELVIFFVFLCMTLGLVVETCLKNFRFRLPPSTAQFLLGLLLGLATLLNGGAPGDPTAPHSSGSDGSGVGVGDYLRQGALSVSGISPHMLLYVFLPPLIFESAFSLNWHLFRRSLVQVLLLAVPGILLASFLTAAATILIYPAWNWAGALLFGVIVSATDPVAVVAILKKTGGHPSLRTLVEGESLVNDGTAVVCFSILLSVVQSGGDTSISAGTALVTFVRMAVGGSLFGFGMSVLSVCWTGRVFNQPLIEISIPLAMAYMTFFIAEALLGVSGVLSVVVFGLHYGAVGRTHISPEVEEYLNEFWEMLAHIANTVVFILSGVIMARRFLLLSVGVRDVGWLVVLYFVVTLIRGAMVASFSPALRGSGYGLTMAKALLIVWGGLRGAVSLCLALFVVLDPILSKTRPRMVDLIFFHVSGIVMLTMCINAVTMGWLVHKIGFDFVAPSKELLFGEAMKEIERAGELEERHLKTDPMYGCARWDDVRSYKWSCVPATTTKMTTAAMATATAALSTTTTTTIGKTTMPGHNCRASFSVSTKDEATRRFLVAVKMSYWQQFRDGLVGRVAVRELIEAVDRALDRLDRQSWAHTSSQNDTDGKNGDNGDGAANKRGGRGKKKKKKKENGTHAAQPRDEDGIPTWADTTYLALEGVRVSSWTKLLLDMPVTRPFALRYQYSRLRYNHDMVGAFLVARQEAIDHLRAIFFGSRQSTGIRQTRAENDEADNRPEPGIDDASERLETDDERHYHSAFEHTIARAQLDIVRARASLFRIQSALPEIAATITTNHAARAVLNAQRRRVSGLKEEGILDDIEAARATQEIEKQMKRLLLHPRRFELPSAGALLSEIAWISSLDAGTRRKLKSVMVERFFPEGGIIIQEGSQGADVFIMARGTAKVTKYCPSPGRRTSIEIGLLGVGSVAGEMASILGGRRSATVAAMGACLCFQIPGPAMKELVQSSTVLRQRLWTICARRMAECALIEREEHLGRDVRRRALRKRLQDWRTVPCVEAFAGVGNNRANAGSSSGQRGGKTFEAHGDVFLAYGTIARLIENNTDCLLPPDAARASTGRMNNGGGVTRLPAMPIRGKSFKLLLGAKERAATHYEVIITAPAYIERLRNENTIRGRVISPEDGDAVLISPSSEYPGSALNNPSGPPRWHVEWQQAAERPKTSTQEKEKDDIFGTGGGGGRAAVAARRSKYTVVEVKPGSGRGGA